MKEHDYISSSPAEVARTPRRLHNPMVSQGVADRHRSTPGEVAIVRQLNRMAMGDKQPSDKGVLRRSQICPAWLPSPTPQLSLGMLYTIMIRLRINRSSSTDLWVAYLCTVMNHP